MATSPSVDDGEDIGKTLGSDFTKKFRDTETGEPKAFFFGRKILDALLEQDDCIGIRMYNAMETDKENKRNLVLVGVDSEGLDQVDLIVADRGAPCPDVCDETSILYDK